MKRLVVLPACLLLLHTLTGAIADSGIDVKTGQRGVTILCTGDNEKVVSANGKNVTFPLTSKDENSGEYKCVSDNLDEASAKAAAGTKIFVKFRSCDNCVELDTASVAGLAAGNLVTTFVIGVAVYLVASHAQINPITSEKKRSDRKHLLPNEMSSRAPNDHYQELRKTKDPKATYDVLSHRR